VGGRARKAIVDSDGDTVTITCQATLNAQGTIAWTGLGGDSQWSTAANWSNPAGPSPLDDVVINAPGQTINAAGPIAAHTLQSSAALSVTGSLELDAFSQITGAFNIQPSQTSQDTLDVANGATVELLGGGSLAGNITLGQGAQLILGGNFTMAPGTTITGPGTLVLPTGATLTVNGQVTVQNLNQAGSLTGPGNLEITSSLNWTAGAMSGLGSTTIDSTATFNITGSVSLSNRSLINAGTTDWQSGTITSLDSTFTNQAAGTFIAHGTSWNLAPTAGGLNVSQFTNAGIFVQSGPATTLGLYFSNSWVVQVQSALSLTGGGQATGGSFSVSQSALLDFHSGTFTLDAGSSIQGLGTVSFSGGGVTVNGAYSAACTMINAGAATFNAGAVTTSGMLSGGVLGGSGSFTINGLFVWTGGTMQDTGTTIVAGAQNGSPAAVLYIVTTPPAPPVSLNRTLENQGQVIWAGDGTISTQTGAVIENQAGGTFQAWGDGTLGSPAAGIVVFNDGTFAKLAGSDSTTLASNVIVSNTGTVSAQSGTLAFNGTVHSTGGTFSLSPAGTLSFNGGALSCDSASVIAGQGAVLFVNETATINGAYNVFSTTITGGQVAFNSNAFSRQVTLNSGTLGGSATLFVTSAFYWYGGTMNGGGDTFISLGGDFFINGAGGQNAQNRTITNNGTAFWDEGARISFLGQVTFNNFNQFEALDGTTLIATGRQNVFNNYGTFIRGSNGGAGDTTLTGALDFNNYRNVNLETGNLNLKCEGVSTGKWTLTDAASLTLQDYYDFNLGSKFSEQQNPNLPLSHRSYGAVIVQGVMAVNTALSLPRLELDSGVITGPGALTVFDRLIWFGGGMSGTGSTIIPGGPAGGTLYLVGSGTLSGRLLNIQGKYAWVPSATIYNSATLETFANPRPAPPPVDFLSLPTVQGWGDYTQKAEYIHALLRGEITVNPPDSLMGPPTVWSSFIGMSALARAALSVQYYRLFGIQLQDDIRSHLSGWFSNQAQETVNYLHFNLFQDPNQPPTASWSFLDYWNLSRGIIAGIGSGAVQAALNLGDLVWKLVTHPIDTVTKMYQGITTLVTLFSQREFLQAAQMLAPNIFELIQKWKTQPRDFYECGFVIGKIVGENGANLLIGAGAGQAIRTLRSTLSTTAQGIRRVLFCFAAGTPIRTPDGEKPIEEIQPGDLVLSASEHDSAGPVDARPVLEAFASCQPVWEIRVGGQSVRTTPLHPFFVRGQGWKPAIHMRSGDLLRSDDGQWVAVESVKDTGAEVPVHHLHIAEYHTFFVGSTAWGFSVWAHNACLRDEIRALVARGVRGAARLLSDMTHPLMNVWRGAYFLAKRVMYYANHPGGSLLRAIELGVGGGRRFDILLRNGLRIDCKSWLGWDTLSAAVKKLRLAELEQQIAAYLRARGSRLMLEFDKIIPGEVLAKLRELAPKYNGGQYGNRLIWIPIQ
jgi:hypothetical protein